MQSERTEHEDLPLSLRVHDVFHGGPWTRMEYVSSETIVQKMRMEITTSGPLKWKNPAPISFECCIKAAMVYLKNSSFLLLHPLNLF